MTSIPVIFTWESPWDQIVIIIVIMLLCCYYVVRKSLLIRLTFVVAEKNWQFQEHFADIGPDFSLQVTPIICFHA